MSPVELRHETAASGSELSLSQGVEGWIDDLIAGGMVLLITSVLVTRAYRWFKSQSDHPLDLVETQMRRAREVGTAAARAWHRGEGQPESGSPSAAGDGEAAKEPVTAGTGSPG